MFDPQITYLDYAASSPLKAEVLDAMMPYLNGYRANPNALHTPGREAASALEKARETIASSIGAATPSELIFTSGGTESDNAAIFGLFLHALRDNNNERSSTPAHLIVSDFEHKAILEPASNLAHRGFRVSYLKPNAQGFIEPKSLDSLLKDHPAKLVSIMMVNNEVGTLQPIKELARVAHAHGALFHTDAVQAFGKVPFNVRELDVDAATLSAHKLGGPRGIGALWLSNKQHINPLILGGGQEHGLRSGTQNVSGAIGFAKAVTLAIPLLEEEQKRLQLLREKLHGLLSCDTRIVFPAFDGEHAPGIIGLLCPGFDSETLILRLDLEGFCVAGGAACSSSRGQLSKSRTLKSIGVDDDLAESFIRVSLGYSTTEDDIERFAQSYLRAISL